MIKVSADFDEGSIGPLVESPANVLTGPTLHWKHKSSSDDQYYWFYFRMDHVLNKPVTVTLTNLVGVYRGNPHLIYTSGTQPVYSYDRINWERIADVSYDSVAHSLRFRHRFIRDSVWVAYAHPYPYERATAFLDSIAGHSPHLAMEVVAHSAQSRPIRLLTITDTSVSNTAKKVVLVTALQHAGECIGGFFAEGMIGYLLSTDAGAVFARKNTIFKIILMMNPDGIAHGMTRLNGNEEDLNQEWDDDYSDTVHAPTEPEVAGVKEWLSNWRHSGRQIDLALDIHSQGQQGECNILHTPHGVLTELAEQLQRYWPIEYIGMNFSGSENECLVKEFHIPAGTFEIPQSTAGNGRYLTIADYRLYGKGTVLGIADYLFPDRSTK